MKILEYNENRDFEQVVLLYQDAQWVMYLKDIEGLKKAYRSSLVSYVIYEENKLIGVIRAVGDGETILYIQDIVVHSLFKRKHVGSNLVEHLLSHYNHVRQILLLTEDENATVRFYESLGFKNVQSINCVAFAKMPS